MPTDTDTPLVLISAEVIDRVDSELGSPDFDFDAFRKDELGQLESANGSLRQVVCDLFATAMKGGDEAGMQAMAGGLFASRVLRYGASEAGVELPVISLVDHGRQLKKIADKLVPVSGQEIDYAEFEAGFLAQQALRERLEKFKNPISRMAATAIFMLHEGTLAKS